jgi:hypothetical protein
MVPAPAGDDASRFLAEPIRNPSGVGLIGKRVTTMVGENPSVGDPGGAAAFSVQDVAQRANVPEGFVRHLVTVGALPSEEAGLGPGRSGAHGCCRHGRQPGSRSGPSSRW